MSGNSSRERGEQGGTGNGGTFLWASVVALLLAGHACSPCAAQPGSTAPGMEPGRQAPLPHLDRQIVPPSVPPGPPQLIPENRGAVNPRTGERYLPSGRGVINPRTGEYYPPGGGGYFNPRTGEFFPRVD